MPRATSDTDADFPRFRPVGERALLVEFGEVIDRTVHENVLLLDRRLAAEPVDGFVESVPAYASVLIVFDPLLTDHRAIRHTVEGRLTQAAVVKPKGILRQVEVCYDADFGPDVQHVADATGLSLEQVIEAHLAGDYSVFMYGFAPGYAYLAGVPQQIQVPRKQSAVRDVAAGSVLIAGPQCLVTTLAMPTGWWIIGRSATKILNPHSQDRPFLFDIGDDVRFRRVSRIEFEGATR